MGRRDRTRSVVRVCGPVEMEVAGEPVRDERGLIDVEATVAHYSATFERQFRVPRWVVGRRRRQLFQELMADHRAEFLGVSRTALEEASRRERGL